jgi:hypothetical protein
MFERAKIQKPGIADEPWYDSIALLNAYELLHTVSFPMRQIPVYALSPIASRSSCCSSQC